MSLQLGLIAALFIGGGVWAISLSIIGIKGTEEIEAVISDVKIKFDMESTGDAHYPIFEFYHNGKRQLHTSSVGSAKMPVMGERAIIYYSRRKQKYIEKKEMITGALIGLLCVVVGLVIGALAINSR